MNDWRTKIFIWIGLPLIAVVGLGLSIQDVGPSWSAKNGGGTSGTFTAVREDCGRRSCSWYGDWASADGASRRGDVILYDEPDGMAKGDTIEALDTGARKGVFNKAGGSTYLLTTGLTLAGLAAAVAFIIIMVRKIKGRGRSRTPATA